MPDQPRSTPEVERLSDHLLPLRPLLGMWRTTGLVIGRHGVRTAELRGHDSWSVLPNGRWITHQSATTTSGVPNYLHEIVGGHHPGGGWQMLVFDEGLLPNLTRVTQEAPMRLTVRGEGTYGVFDLAEEGQAMTATWSRQVDDGQWTTWLELTFVRL